MGDRADLAGHRLTDRAAATAGPDQRARPGYRPDIDGLRAVAVLAVIAFHFGIQVAAGGYVGVDVFFVLSGYLLGGIALKEIEAGTFSARRFYLRRLRRIAPALAAMLLLLTLVMWFTALPVRLAAYGESLIATAFSVSNVHFWQDVGYFAGAASAKPLLHTWSLGVEEQYYLLFPLLMLAVRRWGLRRVRGPAIALFLLSLGIASIGVVAGPAATFYLLPARLWELMLGLLIVGWRPRLLDRQWLRELAGIAGLALIGLPVLLYVPTTPFPGLGAVPPCLGTALLLLAGAQGGTLAGRALSLRPLVFIGLISYSLYLWHWPVAVLAMDNLPGAWPDRWFRVAAILVSILIGWLSWRYVERPWRKVAVGSRRMVATNAMALSVAAAAGLLLVVLDGAPSRLDPRAARAASLLDPSPVVDARNGICFVFRSDRNAEFDEGTCLRRDPGRPNVLLMGDSHAAHLWPGLTRVHPRLNLLQATAAGCKPVLDRSADLWAGCGRLMQRIFDDWLPAHRSDWVILSAAWAAGDEEDVIQTLRWLRGRGIRVILVGPMVRYGAPLPLVLARAIQRGDPGLVDRLREPAAAALDRRMEAIAAAEGAGYFSAYRALCGSGPCIVTDDQGLPVQVDFDHLSPAGSVIVARAFPADRIR